jgi:hypothetical protein
MRTTIPTVAVVLTVGALTAGCGSTDRDPAAHAVHRFEDALAAEDMTQACAALMPSTLEALEYTEGKPCVEALGTLGLPAAGPPESVETYVVNAWVHTARDVLFLSRSDGEWRVLAAGCTPPRGSTGPYACLLGG